MTLAATCMKYSQFLTQLITRCFDRTVFHRTDVVLVCLDL